jgi:hypothetical protein
MDKKSACDKSLAFEMRGGKLKVILEDAVPSVQKAGQVFYVTEAPSVVVGGKKLFVNDVC